jgi:hypothetical protein
MKYFLILLILMLEIYGCNFTNKAGPPKSLNNHIDKVYGLTYQQIPRETSDLKLTKTVEKSIKTCVYKLSHGWLMQKPHYSYGHSTLIKEEFLDNDATLVYESINKYKNVDDLDENVFLAWQMIEALVREGMVQCFQETSQLYVPWIEIVNYDWDHSMKWAS